MSKPVDMRLILDTHVIIWLTTNSPQLPAALANGLADADNELCISRISLLEVAIKSQLAKPDFPLIFAQWLQRVRQFDFELLEITDAHLLQLSQLPAVPGHRAPFDRLLIAQAIAENLTLVSRDGKFASYVEAGLRTRWA